MRMRNVQPAFIFASPALNLGGDAIADVASVGLTFEMAKAHARDPDVRGK